MLDDFEKLKRTVEDLKQRKARAEGAYQEHLSRLKKDYGVKSLKEAEKLLEEYRDKEHALAAEYLAAKKEFEAKWTKVLSDTEDKRTPEQKRRDIRKMKEIHARFYGGKK